MWDGVGGGAPANNNPEDEEAKAADEDINARIAASALAAFANPGNVDAATAAASARLRHYQEQYEYPVSHLAAAQQANRSFIYGTQASEHLRREEELRMRQQALYTLQQQQILQRQELQELEYARQLQQQRVAELAARTRHDVLGSHEGMSVLEAIGRRAPVMSEAGLRTGDEEREATDAAQLAADESGNHTLVAGAPRGKPEAMASAMAAAGMQQENEEEDVAIAVPVVEKAAEKPTTTTPTKKKPRKRKASASPGSRSRKKAAVAAPTVDDFVPPITDVEYENVEALIEQFCRVPLLSEFSRPVALLHPELIPNYNKIVSHPMDLGHVCRAIRRRQYKNTREIQLDMWRIFANCIKYHTAPANKDNSVPSFVSIALHLRDYFNALWQEYMVPSDPPAGHTSNQKSKAPKSIYAKRERDRKNRIATTNATVLSAPCLRKTASAINRFIQMDGRVDKLDVDALFNNSAVDDDGDMDEVVDNLRKLQKKLSSLAEAEQDYNVEELDGDFRHCYGGDLFESKPSLRIRIGHRIDRLAGKIIANIYEANSRGVNQSSVWGCMAAAIWARESSKKPYWPALVLGIMAPADQKEDWHASLTERNESRLPEKLRTDLHAGKRKAELAIRRQNDGKAEQNSFFLVEFMGTHEFIWVKESDMIETFDPDVNPNKSVAAGNVTKKKRSSRSTDVLGSETFATALEEGRWALEEFELQLNDTCGDLENEEDDEQETNYSYAVLCQSDDEAEVEDMARHSEIGHDMTFSETEEANELLAGDGLLDFSAEGRKNARKRTAAMKKKKAEADKAMKKDKGKSKKTKASRRGHSLEREKDREEKKEQRELEKRRKKRTRERERVLKEDTRKKKRRSATGDDVNPSTSGGRRNPLADKSGRASAIVKAYLTGIAKTEDLKPLGMSGVMTLPAAQLDSTGLLGMALAFRAAAGEVNMPESSDPVSKGKPWENVDVDGPITTKEREENLLKQKALLEEEINRLKAATQKRKELREAALKEKRLVEEEIEANDRAVRLSIEKKTRKKPVKKAPKAEDADAEKATETDTEKQETSMEVDTAPSQDNGHEDEPASGAASPVMVGEVVDDDEEEVVEATVVVNED